MVFFLVLIILILHQVTSYNYNHCQQRQTTTRLRSSAENTDTNVAPDAAPRQRRIRYSGKYPKLFSQKHKELEQNATIMARVLTKGGTPAGSHISILLNEIVELVPLPSAVVASSTDRRYTSVDCTLGYGGHTKGVLSKLLSTTSTDASHSQGPSQPLFRHIGIDQDAIELSKTKERLTAQFGPDVIANNVEFHHQNFGDLGSLGLHGQVHFLLADLGFSSMQIDDPTRGFTYKADGPLDMRMDTTKGETAYELLSRVKRKELMTMLEENRYSRSIGTP